MQVEMDLERFIELFRLASLGKLIQGLIHNLNGPLQNLGMDVEMMEHTLRSDRRLPEEVSDSFLARIQRVESEFDQVTGLIRSASMRIDGEGDCQHGNFKDLIEEEISFLSANLYFKHYVRKQIHIGEELVDLGSIPPELLRALCWFIQGVVEEMENGSADAFNFSARTLPSSLEVSLSIEGEGFSLTWIDDNQRNPPSEPSLKIDGHVGTALPLALLSLHGASAACKREPGRVEFTLIIPCSARA